MLKLLLTLASCLMASICAATVAAQRGTDFSGTWVLDETQVRSAPDIPQRLVVEQPLTTTDVFGSSLPPAYLKLTVQRHFAHGIREDALHIGTISGTVGGTAAGTETRLSVEWRGDFLWIERQTLSPSGASVQKRKEAWRIDDLGRLVITIENREPGEAAKTQTLAYRRDKQ